MGGQLAETIAQKLNIWFSDGITPDASGDHDILRLFHKEKDYLRKFWQIRDGIILANSIDNYVDNHRHDTVLTRIGKAAIYKSIREAENNSAISNADPSHRGKIDFSRLSDTWYVKLFRLLQENVAQTNVEEIFSDARFVVFNYDRCLEHFLFNALKLLYALEDGAAADIVNRAHIVHVYGRTGRLPWQSELHEGECVEEIGQQASWRGLESSDETIKTFTEQVNSTVSETIRQYLDASDRIVFLGLSYADQNISLLKRRSEAGQRISILGTARNFSPWDTDIVSSRLIDIYGAEKVKLDNTSGCSELFDRFRQTLIH